MDIFLCDLRNERAMDFVFEEEMFLNLDATPDPFPYP
jgi:hypothetical protein